jgi:hypothetical protein
MRACIAGMTVPRPQKPVPLLVVENQRALLLNRFELIFELTHGDQLLVPTPFGDPEPDDGGVNYSFSPQATVGSKVMATPLMQ